MFTKSELLDAIDELEQSPATYQNAEKLATFYLLFDHLYTIKEPERRFESVKEVTIDKYGDSEFLKAISGQESESVWMILDELMTTIKALQPRLYQATMDRIKSG